MKRPSLTLALALALTTPVLFSSARAQSTIQENQSYHARLLAGVKQLAFFERRWGLAKELATSDGGWRAEPESPGEPKVMTVRSAMNGLYYKTEVQSGKYRYNLIFSFDVAQNRYRIASRDDQSGLLDIYEGDFGQNGALAVDNIGSGAHYASDGVRFHNRLTFTPRVGGGFTWLVEATKDDGKTWYPQLRAVASPLAAD